MKRLTQEEKKERSKKMFAFFLLLGGRKERGSITRTGEAFGVSRERARQVIAKAEYQYEMQKN